MTPFQQAILQAHRAAVQNGDAIRRLAKREVTRVIVDNVEWIVKGYRRNVLQRLLGISAAKSTRGIQLLQGMTPPCKEIWNADGWSWMAYAAAGRHNLFYPEDRWDVQTKPSEEQFANAGNLLASIHNANIFHRDTKTPNFVVNSNLPDLPPVVIVDCDEVCQYKHLSIFKRHFNLAQFVGCACGPEKEARGWLQAFFHNYARTYTGPSPIDWNLLEETIQNNSRIEKRANPKILRLEGIKP